MRKQEIIRLAFIRSLSVMAGYIVLGTGFGVLLRGAGYGVLWSFAMSLLIYAGSMQYVGVSLLAGGASLLTAALTTFMVNARHLFYSISMIGRYRDAGKYKPYLIFGLTDETYSLLSDGKPRTAPIPICTVSASPCLISATGSPEASWEASWAQCFLFPPPASNSP